MRQFGFAGFFVLVLGAAVFFGMGMFFYPFFVEAVFTGPTCPSGTCPGAIGVDGANNISIGTTVPESDTKFILVASSTNGNEFTLQVTGPAGTSSPYLVVRNDGSVGIGTSTVAGAAELTVSGDLYATGNVTAGILSGTLSGDIAVPAANVTPGVFDSTNGSTSSFAFAGKLGIATTTTSTIPQTLSVYGGAFVSSSLGVGTASPVSKVEVHDTDQVGVILIPYVDPSPGSQNLSVFTTNAPAINQGGTLGLGGRYSGASVAAFGAVAGIKETAGSDSAGYLSFMTNDGLTGVVSERMRLTSGGLLGVGNLTPPLYRLDLGTWGGPAALRLQPTTQPTGNKGVIYYDQTDDKFYCYQGSAYVPCLGTAGPGTPNRVAKFITASQLGDSSITDTGTTTTVSLNNNVGSGFTVYGGYFVVDNTASAISEPSISGQGTRFMWIPSKAATRAGYVSSTQWDIGNIGQYSAAFGHSLLASGQGSFAGGGSSTVAEAYSASFGFNNVIDGTSGGGSYSFAAGSNNKILKSFSAVFGSGNTVDATSSAVFGASNLAEGEGLFASGLSNTVRGRGSAVFGTGNVVGSGSLYPSLGAGESVTATGRSAVAMGYQSSATGNYSVAMGDRATASGANGIAMGSETVAAGANSVVFGQRVTASAAAVGSVVFGLDSTYRTVTSPNVMAVLGGNVGVGSLAPGARLTVSGGDVFVSDITKGVILRTPDNTKCYRLSINNSGVLQSAQVNPCP